MLVDSLRFLYQIIMQMLAFLPLDAPGPVCTKISLKNSAVRFLTVSVQIYYVNVAFWASGCSGAGLDQDFSEKQRCSIPYGFCTNLLCKCRCFPSPSAPGPLWTKISLTNSAVQILAVPVNKYYVNVTFSASGCSRAGLDQNLFQKLCCSIPYGSVHIYHVNVAFSASECSGHDLDQNLSAKSAARKTASLTQGTPREQKLRCLIINALLRAVRHHLLNSSARPATTTYNKGLEGMLVTQHVARPRLQEEVTVERWWQLTIWRCAAGCMASRLFEKTCAGTMLVFSA